MPELDALILARLQFAFTISFHIIFPAFTIGLASYLAVLEALWLCTGDERLPRPLPVLGQDLRRLLRHGRRLRASSWPTSSAPTGASSPTAAGADHRAAAGLRGADRLLPRGRLPRRHAVRLEQGRAAACTSSPPAWSPLGTLISAFWILSANSWMQTPAGYAIVERPVRAGRLVAVIFNPSFPYRLVHMVLAAYLTTACVVGGVGAWHLLRDRARPGRAHDVLDGDVDGRHRGADPDLRRRPARPQHAASTSRPRSRRIEGHWRHPRRRCR